MFCLHLFTKIKTVINKTFIKLKDKKLSLWDVGGQDKLRVYWSNFFHNVKILAFVVDASDRFDYLQNFFHYFFTFNINKNRG